MDTNARVADLLRDMAVIQTDKQKTFAYKRAAAAIFGLERPLDTLLLPNGSLEKIAGIGSSTSKIVLETLRTGSSATVERAVAGSGKALDVQRSRELRHDFLSRHRALEVLSDQTLRGVARDQYLGDFQMHSTWSDGRATIAELAEAAMDRGYTHLAVTDHSHGLSIARGMSSDDARRQHAEIDTLNEAFAGRFRVIKGVEANIATNGDLDLSDDEIADFELVLAAPHSQLRKADDQTTRMLRAVSTPGVHVLAHPRGRVAGTRAGIVADWDRVFRVAAKSGVAIEIDGDPARQDLDHGIARRALDAGCLFALDSDAHAPDELSYADTALAHARLAGIPAKRIINCWTTPVLLDWLHERRARR